MNGMNGDVQGEVVSGSQALVPQSAAAVAVVEVKITDTQVDLIRSTICADATPAEMQLFFYDCKRRGVHPLDKLIHFTKRQGKYTPVTSIDFFRARAASTKEHMGTDDAAFQIDQHDQPIAASVTVYRLVQGARCAFTATARWAEYCPTAPNDFMWKKMPYGQLGKCAEALALRKGFPQELDGLHTVEEMEQARDDAGHAESAAKTGEAPRKAKETVAQDGDVLAVTGTVVDVTPKQGSTNGRAWIKWGVKLDNGQTYSVFKDQAMADMAISSRDEKFAVTVHYKKSAYGNDAVSIEPAAERQPGGDG